MFNLDTQLKELPQKSGVYIMKDEQDNIIYVGKAKNLRSRVRQYFQSAAQKSLKTAQLVKQIKEFECIITESEIEALILENNLIKKNKPKYNILLKDDKTFPYIKVTTSEQFPRIFITRKALKDKARYFGPFTSECKNTVEIVHKLWPVRRCHRKLPQELNKERPCLNFYIKNCMGPCNGYVDEKTYSNMIEDIMDFLSGKYERIITSLTEKMNIAAANLDFEQAAELRDKINSIRNSSRGKLLESQNSDNKDIVAFARAGDEALVQVFFIRGGKMTDREHFLLEGAMDMSRGQIMAAFITQFYSEVAFIPKELVLEDEPDNREIISKWLNEIKGSAVSITVPQKGSKHKLIDIAHKNAVITLEQFGEKIKREARRTTGAIEEIRKALEVKKPLLRIEAYDISNIQGYESVGSMVVFEQGKPKKSDYRKFKIETVIGPNDYASIEEVIFRRFNRYFEEKKFIENGDKLWTKFSKLPDAIFVDGGRGQVNAALRALSQLDINILVCGMIKDNKHKTKAIYYEGKEIYLPLNGEGFKLITRIQDEVHRFAYEYHVKLRKKASVRSVLDDIKGIGPARRKSLIKHFSTIENIMKAEVEELLKVEGMNIKVASSVYEFFRK